MDFELIALIIQPALLVGAFIFAIYLFRKSAADTRRRREEHERAKAEVVEKLGQILEVFSDEPEPLLEQMLEGLDTDQYYRPKRGERIIAVFPCAMAQMVTETKAYRYGGLSMSLKVWGPVRYRAGDISVAKVQTRSLKVKGNGALVVTNKKLHFNAAGHGKDWSRTWRSISTWGVYEDAIQVELSNGKPLVFLLDSMNPLTHPGFVAAVVEYAHDAD